MFNSNFAAPAVPLSNDGARKNRTPGALEVLWIWACRARSRRALAKLDPHLLHDIGWTVKDVEQEVAKPFWKA